MIIYADILFLVNLYIDYFLLLCVKNFFHLEVKTYRLVIASVVGGAVSLFSLLPLSFALSLPIAVLSSCLICLIVFGYGNLFRLIKSTICFYSFGFIFSGIILALVSIFPINGTAVIGGKVYFDISLIYLVLFTLLAYFISLLIDKFKGRCENKLSFFTLEITHNNKQILLRCKLDTENNLLEPFSATPVIVAQKSVFAEVFPDLNEFLPEKFRLIPFNSIGGKGLLPAFLPEKIYLIKNNEKIKINFYIALFDGSLSHGAYNSLIGEEISEYINNFKGEAYEY